jgi:hypothetical protein
MKKFVSLSLAKSGDSRKPIHAELMIQDADGGVDNLIRLDEHQFAHLMSGSVVAVDAVV